MENSNSASFLKQVNMVMIARPATQTIVYRSSFDSEEGINPDSASTSGINTIEVGIGSVETCVSAVGPDYQNVGLVSLDGLFAPYAIHWSGASHSSLPYWEVPNTGSSDVNSWKLNPFNQNRRFYDGTFHADTFYASGHTITLANSLQGVGKSASGDLNVYKDMAENPNVDMSLIRSVSLKAPLVLTGWGYDTNGSPVPSGSASGFHPEAFRNPNLWKSGPLDTRWDDTRKVWTAGGAGTIKVRFSIRESDCANSSAVVKILSRTKGQASVPEEYEIYDTGISDYLTELNEAGQTVRSKFLTVYDKLGCFLNESDVNLANRLGYAEYMYGREYASYQPWTAWEITALAEQQTECEI